MPTYFSFSICRRPYDVCFSLKNTFIKLIDAEKKQEKFKTVNQIKEM